MLKRLFSRRAPGRALEASIPPGQRVYAIGDIHGCDDQLAELLARIDADDRARGGDLATLVFLGDLVDRGPRSAQVVERLRELDLSRGNCRFLSGNHEEVFLMAMAGDAKALRFFVRIGGEQTLKSYGIDDETYRDLDFPGLMALAQSIVPQAHLDFIAGFEDMIQIGDYVFVHAGVRPDVPLAEQKRSDLRWIREDFLRADDIGLPAMVVHGHTISHEVEFAAQRIGIDTGAYATGLLSAVGFEGTDRWTLHASA